MGDFAANISLSSLDGTNGFRIDGQTADFLGRSVAGAGDLNGDGLGDVAFSRYGVTYVLFGKSTAFAATINPTTFNGTDGFALPDFLPGDGNGFSLAGGFDFNGDGVQDLLVGAANTDDYGSSSGSAYVIFGRTTGFAGTLTSAILDGVAGFRINGLDANDLFGLSARSAGDVNGDGLDDLIIGARNARSGGFDTGAGYVIFGRESGMPATMNVSALDGANGFRIGGAISSAYSQLQVTGAGDLNGDGFDDVVVSQPYASSNGVNSGSAFVVFGKASGFAAQVNFTDLNGANGFQIIGERARDMVGQTLASAGDVNGDGLDDLIVGSTEADTSGGNSGAAWIIFGRTTGFSASLNLTTLNGANGFQINGVDGADRAATAVSAAGDINGDGIGDLIIGAPNANPGSTITGAAYVLFGRSTPFSAVVGLADINGVNGFRITGAATGDAAGSNVSAAGDVNGDGVDDLIVAARGADPTGANTGAVYVIYGHRVAETFVGGAGDETANGSSMIDTLSGGGGQDVLNGLAGDDLLDGGDNSDVLNGGDGADDLLGGMGGDILNGDAGDDALDGGDGADKLNGGAGADTLIGGLGNDRLSGGDDNDSLSGGDGADTLDGGAGTDSLVGGLGNDIYVLDSLSLDLVIENAAAGYDIVRASRAVTLADNVEGLELQGSGNIDGVGNALSNTIQGNSGKNVLQGLAGVDTLNGNDGDDRIDGGTGNDLLRGGSGADTFVATVSAGPTLESDQVYDFSAAEGDTVDVNDSYVLVSAFSKVAGQMTVTFAAGITTLKIDATGDGKADYQMKINGDLTGDTGWLV